MTLNSGTNEEIKYIQTMEGIIYILVDSYQLFIL